MYLVALNRSSEFPTEPLFLGNGFPGETKLSMPQSNLSASTSQLDLMLSHAKNLGPREISGEIGQVSSAARGFCCINE